MNWFYQGLSEIWKWFQGFLWGNKFENSCTRGSMKNNCNLKCPLLILHRNAAKICGHMTITPTLYDQKYMDTLPNDWVYMIPVKGTFNATTYKPNLDKCTKILGKTLSALAWLCPCVQCQFNKDMVLWLLLRNLNGLRRALTWILLNTFVMNRNMSQVF